MLEQDKNYYVDCSCFNVWCEKKMNLKWTLEMKQLNYLGILPLHFKNLLIISYLVVPPLRNIKNKYKNDDIFTMDVHPHSER